MIRSALLRVEAIEGLGRDLGSGLLVLALALSSAACGGSPPVLTAFRTEQQRNSITQAIPSSGWTHRVAPITSRGSPSYGQAGEGRYPCDDEAKDAGMREMAN
jgi:hypothetical protein